MIFPNAATGVKKIYTAQLLSLAAGAFGVISALIAVFTIAAGSAQQSKEAVAAGLGMAGIVAIGVAVLAVVVYVLMLTGVFNASKDDGSFKAALYVILIGLVISVVGMIFSSVGIIKGLTQIAVEIANLLATVYIIMGVRNLSRKLKNVGMETTGSGMLRLTVVLYALSLIAIVLSLLLRGSEGTVASSVCSMVAAALHIVKDIFLLLYFKKASQMLNG